MELLTKVALGAKNLALDTAVAVKDEVAAGVQRLPWWIVTGGAVLLGQWLQCL